MTTNFTIEDILRGTSTGRMQSVGQMQVIPIIGEDDDTFAPPEVEVNTSNYGTVNLLNDNDRPTIVPPGAGWVVDHAAQDHAIGGGSFLKAKERKTINTAMCIQQSQPGYIRAAKHPMVVLPVALRTSALRHRKKVDYSKLWDDISRFNRSLGARQGGHLEFFLTHFKKELDEFVAEFELVPNQVGAIVLVGGHLAGVERAPSSAFWEVVWEPLIRVCYGSLAIYHSRQNSSPPATRIPLKTKAKTLKGLAKALEEARIREDQLTEDTVREVHKHELKAAAGAEEALGKARLVTMASQGLSGQIVTNGKNSFPYASLCAARV